jgi:hypothetical protein
MSDVNFLPIGEQDGNIVFIEMETVLCSPELRSRCTVPLLLETIVRDRRRGFADINVDTPVEGTG